MEQMTGGSIQNMLKQYGAFSEPVIKKFATQLVQGLVYLHRLGVIHRDLKCGNILSDGSGKIKLADFGAAKYLDKLPKLDNQSVEFCKSLQGSLYWMAPELLKQETHGRKIDVWSLGCCLIEMATAQHPWPNCKTIAELIFQIMN